MTLNVALSAIRASSSETAVFQIERNSQIYNLYRFSLSRKRISGKSSVVSGMYGVKIAAYEGSKVEDRGLPPTGRRRRIAGAADAASWRGLKALLGSGETVVSHRVAAAVGQRTRTRVHTHRCGCASRFLPRLRRRGFEVEREADTSTPARLVNSRFVRG